MMLFFRFIWPKSWRSFSVWIPLIAVGLITCVGLSLAMGFRSGLLAQHEAATMRDGSNRFSPDTREAGEPPLRSFTPVATGYGPLAVTVYWGEEGQRLDLPGISTVGASGTALASPAVLAQLEDDWTGELRGWLGDRPVRELPKAAVAHPRELAIVEFTDTVSPETALKSSFQPIRAGKGWSDDSSYMVIMGLLILVLPSIALARAGAAVHLNARSRRYGRTVESPRRASAKTGRAYRSRHRGASLGRRTARLCRLCGHHVVFEHIHACRKLVLGARSRPSDRVGPCLAARSRPGRAVECRPYDYPRRTGPRWNTAKRTQACVLSYVPLLGWRRGRSRRHVLGFKRGLYAVGVADYGGDAPERRRPRGTVPRRGGRRRQVARRMDAGTGGRITDVSGRSRSRAGRIRHIGSRPFDSVLRVRELRQPPASDGEFPCHGRICRPQLSRTSRQRGVRL